MQLLLVPHLPVAAGYGPHMREFPWNEWNKSTVPAIDGFTVVASAMHGNVQWVIVITLDYGWSRRDIKSGGC